MEGLIKLRFIEKGSSPSIFEEWKANECEDWKPTWSDLRGREKQSLREALASDQGYICCYCGERISSNTETEIEHVYPRSLCTEDENKKLDYQNLLASCSGGKIKRMCNLPSSLSCNHKRGDILLKISPLDTECEERFLFTFDGQILAKNRSDVECEQTIKDLGLDIERLKNKRQASLKPFLSLDREDAKKIIEYLGVKQIDEESGKLSYKPFNFVIIDFLKRKFSLEQT